MASNVINFFSGFWTGFTDLFKNLTTDIGNFFTELPEKIFNFFSGLVDTVSGIFSWLGNFFTNLYDFFIHIFVPTDEQWEEIKQDYSELGNIIKSKLPFVSLFQNTLENAKNSVVDNRDMLVINMPSFSFFGGQTEEKEIVNVRDAYEPYRIQIRSLLALIVYGSAFVYLVKTVLNYKATASGLDQVSIQTKGKGE